MLPLVLTRPASPPASGRGAIRWFWLVLLVACQPVHYRATSERARQCYWDCRTSNGQCRAACAAYRGASEQSACVANCEDESQVCLKNCPDVVPSR